MKLRTTTILQAALWAAITLLAAVKDSPIPAEEKPAAVVVAGALSAALHRYAGKRDENGALLGGK